MKIITKTVVSLRCLKQENELHLAYVFGQILDESNDVKNKKCRYPGVLFRVLIFFRSLWLTCRWHSASLTHTDVLVFAGTDNQFNSLVSTIESMDKLGISNTILISWHLGDKNRKHFANSVDIKFSFADLISASVLFGIRAWSLYWGLRKQKRFIEINQYFDVFCEAYVFLPYFLTQLKTAQPGLVVLSNDHNLPNRCLRLAAEALGIKTLYMQHASVSDLFPPLEFDYALLDGKIALDNYTKCFEKKKSTPRVTRNIAQCKVFLSGQKKPVAFVSSQVAETLCIGIGVNTLDDFHCVLKVLELFVDERVNCIVRTHPAQSCMFLAALQSFITNKPSIKWSNAREHSLNNFFSKVSCLMAGNTSLHLEAALAGLPTFYFEMSDVVQLPDYYGYVKNGLSHPLEKEFTLQDLINGIENAHSNKRNQSIKQYSETYQTAWQDREGELAALVIKKIIIGETFEDVFQKNHSDIYSAIYKLERQ